MTDALRSMRRRRALVSASFSISMRVDSTTGNTTSVVAELCITVVTQKVRATIPVRTALTPAPRRPSIDSDNRVYILVPSTARAKSTTERMNKNVSCRKKASVGRSRAYYGTHILLRSFVRSLAEQFYWNAKFAR